MSYLGVDVGTSSTKALLVDDNGVVRARTNATYATHRSAAGAAVLRPDEIIGALETVLAAVARAAPEQRPIALSLAVVGEALVPVDAGGRPLDDLVLPMDYRSQAVYRSFVDAFGGERLQAISGHPVHPMFSLAKVAWWLLDRGLQPARFLDLQSLLIGVLGGRHVTDRSQASRTQLFDISRDRWSTEVLEAIGLDASRLPEVKDAGSVVAHVSPEAAEQFGLPAGLDLVVGGFDQACAALGQGVVEEGDVLDNTGTTLCVGMSSHLPLRDSALFQAGFHGTRHVLTDRFFLNGGSQAGGQTLSWCDAVFRPSAGDSGVSAWLDRVPNEPSNITVLPFFTGSGTPRPDPGRRASIHDLTFDTSAEELFAGALDALDFEARLVLETLERHVGRARRITVSGAPSRSPLWIQRKADSYGREVVTMSVNEGSAYGAAALAAAGSGSFPTPEAAVRSWLSEAREYRPAPERREAFLLAFERYRDASSYSNQA